MLPPSTDYTDKDFDSLRTRLIALVRSVFPTWTDFNVANFGNILLEMFAFTGDVLLYYQDNQAQESRISTAQLRRSMIGLAKLVGYQLPGASAATTLLTVQFSAPPVGSITIAAGDRFSTLEITDPVVFQVLSDVVIAPGSDPATAIVEVENSATIEQSFTSNNLPNQSYLLSEAPFVDNSEAVVAGNGAYTKVDSFLDSLSSDRHYTVTVDENSRATIVFGNGINGAIPTGVINTLYKVGGGVAGNVEPNAIRKALQSYTDSLGNPVQIALVTNAERASGGAPPQSIEAARQQIPRATRVLERSVAREDFEINAERVSGVARALMLTSNELASIPENTGVLYVVPEGGGTPSPSLKAAVLTQVTETYPSTLTFVTSVEDAQYLAVNIQATVFLRAGQVPSVAAARIRANLSAFFQITNEDGSRNENVDFGANYLNAEGSPVPEIAFSDIYNVIRDTTGIRKIGDTPGSLLLNDEPSDLAIDVFQFPILGTVTLINGDTGGPLE